MRFNNRLAYSQSKAGATFFGGIRGFDLSKAVEYSLQLVGRNAASLVLDINFNSI